MPPQLVTIKQIAKAFGESTDELRRRIKASKLQPALRNNKGEMFFDKQQLEAWYQQTKTSTGIDLVLAKQFIFKRNTK
jgi:hypothetical protein